MATAAILTIGNELVSGDVPNTNGAWLAKRLAPLGVETRLLAAVPDEIETIAELDSPRGAALRLLHRHRRARWDARRSDARGARVRVRRTAGGGARARRRPARALRRATPSTPRAGPRSRAVRVRSRIRSAAHPASRSRTSTCCRVCPSEMEAMFDSIAEEFRRGSPIGSWRRTYRTARERDRARARRGGRALARRARRLVSDVRPRWSDRRGRREVERPGRAARRRRRGSSQRSKSAADGR